MNDRLPKDILEKILSGKHKTAPMAGKVDPIGAMALYSQGFSLEAIAKFYEVAASTVRYTIKYIPGYKELAKEHLRDHERRQRRRRTPGKFNGDLAWEYYVAGIEVAQLVPLFTVHGGTIRRYFKAHHAIEFKKINKQRRRERQQEKFFSRKRAWELHEQGFANSIIARRLHVNVGSVQEALQKYQRHDGGSTRAIITPDGRFRTAGAAAEYYGFVRATAIHRAKHEKFGWRYETPKQIAVPRNINTIWINNGTSNKRINSDDTVPNYWTKGFLRTRSKGRGKNTRPYSRPVNTPDGRFETGVLAAKHHGISTSSVGYRIANVEGWSYENNKER